MQPPVEATRFHLSRRLWITCFSKDSSPVVAGPAATNMWELRYVAPIWRFEYWNGTWMTGTPHLAIFRGFGSGGIQVRHVWQFASCPLWRLYSPAWIQILVLWERRALTTCRASRKEQTLVGGHIHIDKNTVVLAPSVSNSTTRKCFGLTDSGLADVNLLLLRLLVILQVQGCNARRGSNWLAVNC
jgi:hypothetical protein